MKENKIHEKAVRLVEGGVVDVDGHSVRMGGATSMFDPCWVCEMDCICRKGGDMCSLCEECDKITHRDCFLKLVTDTGAYAPART